MKCTCGHEISQARYNAGYKVCVGCGEKAAQAEIRAKANRIAPAYNKGPLVYLGAPEDAKHNIQQAGKKTASIIPDVSIVGSLPVVQNMPKKNFPKINRHVIGVFYIGQEGYVWYEGDDPKEKGATRQMKF